MRNTSKSTDSTLGVREAFRSAKNFAMEKASPGLFLLLAMTTVVWRQTLLAGKTLAHGDAIVFGLPLFGLRTRFFYGHASALWANTIFGGHPLFAEGQAAFLSPLPMVLAATVTPLVGDIYTENLFPFLCMILTGIGVLGLSRSLGISRWAAAFAALAVVFAPMWLNFQSNAGVSGPFLWVPWCLWAFEEWLKRPNIRSAVLLALAGASLFIAGYPQASHGTIIYMSASLLTIPFYAEARKIWAASWRVRVATGALAIVLCIGIAAVQWMPLLELVGLSHRNVGAALIFQVAPEFFFRGMLYSFHTIASDGSDHFSPCAGSLLVCILASCAIVLNRSPRIAGHIVAALVLLQLGLGMYWPPFRFVYEHGLVPGLHYFRDVFLYIAIAIIAVAVVAASAADDIAKRIGESATAKRSEEKSHRSIIVGFVVLAIFWVWALFSLPTPNAPRIEFFIVLAAVVGIAALIWFKSAQRIPLLLTTLLVVECCLLRLAPFRFYDKEVLQKPGSVAAIRALPDWREFKVIDTSALAFYGFLDSRSPKLVRGVRGMLAAMSGSTPILWDIHGMDGALALPLARRIMLNPLLLDEINGNTTTLPGARLIDVLGIRFITVNAPVHTSAFRVFWHRDDNLLMENAAALPRFQIYDHHATVESPDAALRMIENWKFPILVIENPSGDGHQTEMPDAPDVQAVSNGKSATFKVQHAKATRYDLTLSAKRPVWLFLADANYPGWKAYLDGKETPLFSAQILGKAVGIPKGRHSLSIQFHSMSFLIGAWISAISLALALLAWIFGPKLTSPFFAAPKQV